MLVRRHNSEDRFQRPKPEPLQQRKRKQQVEATQAMKDYRRAQDAARERMTMLREERRGAQIMFFFFSNRFGVMGSILISLVLTVVLLRACAM